jgi:pilus assembly protein Flp/PilA
MNEIYRCICAGARRVKKWQAFDAGITSIEYARIGALIAVVIVGAVTNVGSELLAAYNHVAGCVTNPSSCQ